jgi:hypothetical protein
MVKIFKYTGVCICAAAVILMTAWGTLAIWYSNLSGGYVRAGLAGLFVLATLLAFVLLPGRLRTLAGFFVVFAGIAAWWVSIPASNDRAWQPDAAVLPCAAVKGEQVTIYNIRNLNYRTETDFDVRYYDKTFDLNRLDSVDLIAVYWTGDGIAHIMVSFGFEGKDFVAFSIEARKEKGEGYSTLKGFFKQYELTYVVADERDLIRLRTDYRNPPEDIYLYRGHMTPQNSRKFFMEYVRQINSLKENPEWYNTLTTNCTTDVIRLIRAYGGKARYNWKVLFSGYAPQYAYENGSLDTRIPFEELRKESYINPKARAIGDDPQFSRKIREGLPRQEDYVHPFIITVRY